jgi:succinate dehydrogenase/fumarate reductase cytochrome b subunit
MEKISTPRLARIQAQTGIVLALYLAMHLTNTLTALGGEGAYDGFQRVVRYVYQNPVAEILLLGSIVVHIIVGVMRYRRRTAGEKITLRIRLHRYAGYFLALFIAGHVLATRMPAVLYDIHVGFRALSYTMHRFPGYFIPYYMLLALSGLYHAVHGTYVALGTLGVRVPQGLRKGKGFVIPVALVSTALVTAVLALAGFLFPLHDPMDNDFARLGEQLLAD